MNRVFLKTYGCQMNERDSEAVAEQLRERGYRIVGREDEADILLLNTCAVRDQAEQKAIGKMGYLAHRKRTAEPGLFLGILGCMAQNRGSGLLDTLPDLDLVLGTQRLHHAADHLDAARAARASGRATSPAVDLAEEPGSQNSIRQHGPLGGRVTAFVSIQQGCNMACSFCIVPRTRGDERSRPMEDIVDEVRSLADRGVREVTLLGQIVTSYGRRNYPHTGGTSPFVQLLERVAAVPGIARIRFTSPHPRGFKDDLADAFRRIPQLMPHCHLPLQSGSDRILREMNRPYTRDAYLRIIERLRAAREDIHFSTDVIVGFPGESDDDFAQTEDLFARVGYDMAYIFKYSIRTGTPAAERDDQVGEVEKELRQQRLLRLLGESSARRVAAMVGRTLEVLVEEVSPSGRITGRTPGNRVVHADTPGTTPGTLIPIQITRATPAALYGEPVASA